MNNPDNITVVVSQTDIVLSYVNMRFVF